MLCLDLFLTIIGTKKRQKKIPGILSSPAHSCISTDVVSIDYSFIKNVCGNTGMGEDNYIPVLFLSSIRDRNMPVKNELSRNFNRLLLPNCPIDNYAVRVLVTFELLLSEKHLFGSYRVILKFALHQKFSFGLMVGQVLNFLCTKISTCSLVSVNIFW